MAPKTGNSAKKASSTKKTPASLRSKVNKQGVLLFKGKRMNHVKYRNSVPQFSADVQKFLDELAQNFVIELTASAMGVKDIRGKRSTLSRRDVLMAAKDMQLTGLAEDVRARRVRVAKVNKRRHQ